MVLKNLGFSVPAPILQYYNWPGRFAAMEHQKDTAAFLTTHKRALCLNAPGTGKSISALWAADFLLDEGVAKKVLIVAPLSTVKVVWGRELKHHLPHRSFIVCTGTKQKRIDLLATPGVQYVIINHDGFTNMTAELKDFDVVIYDEATALKSPSSQRYKIFAKWMAKNQPWLWMLTGTPISQTPADAWTLAEAASGFTRDNTMSPLQGALIAATLVNQGKMVNPYAVESVHLQDGEPIYAAVPEAPLALACVGPVGE
jgi:hypothetical protein